MGGLSFAKVVVEDDGVVVESEERVGVSVGGGSFQRSRSLRDGSEDEVSFDDSVSTELLLLALLVLPLCW